MCLCIVGTVGLYFATVTHDVTCDDRVTRHLTGMRLRLYLPAKATATQTECLGDNQTGDTSQLSYCHTLDTQWPTLMHRRDDSAGGIIE